MLGVEGVGVAGACINVINMNISSKSFLYLNLDMLMSFGTVNIEKYTFLV